MVVVFADVICISEGGNTMSWFVYLLTDGRRTYVGSTTDIQRRLRQHNAEISGGARATQGRKWYLVSCLEGFDNRSSACRWEKIIKNRSRGLRQRRLAFLDVFCGICPGSSKKKHYKPPVGLIYSSYKGDT